MAHSYTPGLTVTERTLVQRRRLLPIPGAVLVQAGEQVRAETVVARTDLPGKVHVVNVANLLGIAPDEVPDYLVKQEGAAIEKDEVLAESRPFISWFKTQVRSPITGTVESVSSVTGQVILREPPRPLQLLAYVDGRVVEVLPAQGVVVETDCTLIQGIFGIGGETSGVVTMAVQTPDAVLTPAHLTAAMKGTIVVAGAFADGSTLQRARESGIAGLVVGGVHDKDLRQLLGYDLGIAITGTERVGFTLILTEGFGAIPMASKTFALLSRHAGQRASISGATQIRAGVIRPEIIIARDPGQASGIEAAAIERSGIRVGDQVRIIRDPLFGKIGSVVELPADPQPIETESQVRVLEVQFPDGRRAVIPRANVELIEG
jgi:hypothetical protein